MRFFKCWWIFIVFIDLEWFLYDFENFVRFSAFLLIWNCFGSDFEDLDGFSSFFLILDAQGRYGRALRELRANFARPSGFEVRAESSARTSRELAKIIAKPYKTKGFEWCLIARRSREVRARLCHSAPGHQKSIKTMQIHQNSQNPIQNHPKSIKTMKINHNFLNRIKNNPESIKTMKIHQNYQNRIKNNPKSINNENPPRLSKSHQQEIKNPYKQWKSIKDYQNNTKNVWKIF